MPGGRRPKPATPDGRANNGGARQGTPGTPYQNRRDLQTQKPTAAPNQEYGKAGQQLASQRAVPMAGAAAGVPPTAQPAPGQGPMQAPPPPDLYRPTELPNEPVTHGLPTGPGGGPEALPIQNTQMGDPIAIQIRAMLRANPNNQELANLVADLARPQ
jgi:hypothetical protein